MAVIWVVKWLGAFATPQNILPPVTLTMGTSLAQTPDRYAQEIEQYKRFFEMLEPVQTFHDGATRFVCIMC
jgi:hypothetical protein